ncbi:MAG: GNAT family N-acetyltransferase [Gammaproteobacteria bacterium]|nr:MAG: GNAT family N-acetyltransferase [Gammaproteobacteria bacterium]
MIRKAAGPDLASIRDCAQAAYAGYVDRIGRKPAPMVADFATLIDNGYVDVDVEDSGVIRGFVVYYPRADCVHLANVAIHPDYQGQGLGRRLIERAEGAAVASGYRRIELYTNAKMTENLALYPKLGYRQFDRRTEDGFDRVYFDKSLSGR